MMVGLDSYVATKKSIVGVDWLNLASGALKTAGGAATAFESGGAGGAAGNQPTAQAAADKDKAQLEAQKKAAEQSASTWKKVGVVALVAVALGGAFLYHRHS